MTVNIVDSSGQIVESFTTAVTNNTWSVNVSSTDAKLLHDGSYTVTADVSDAAGNPAPTATHTITVDETPPTVAWLPQAENGVEGTTIALGTITATVNSLPGHSNSVQSLVVTGIPVGAVLSDGTNNFMATSTSTSVDVKSWNLGALKITLPNDANFTLTVTATDQDGNTASASELVTVAPLAPDLSAAAAPTTEDHTSALTITLANAAQLFGNGDSVRVMVTLSNGATLSQTGSGALVTNTGNGTFTLTAHSVADLSGLTIIPASEFEGSLTLTVAATAIDTEGDASTTVTASQLVTVNPVADAATLTAPTTAVIVHENDQPALVNLLQNSLGSSTALTVALPALDQDDTITVTLTAN